MSEIAIGQVDRPVGPDRQVRERLLPQAWRNPHWRREGHTMIGRAGEQHDVVGRAPRVARPGQVDVPGVGPFGLVDRQVDLVLEKPGRELPGRRALRDQDGSQVMSAVLVVGGDVGGPVHRLPAVEADEPVEEPAVPVEGLSRVTRSPARGVRRRSQACR